MSDIQQILIYPKYLKYRSSLILRALSILMITVNSNRYSFSNVYYEKIGFPLLVIITHGVFFFFFFIISLLKYCLFVLNCSYLILYIRIIFMKYIEFIRMNTIK